MWALGRLFGRLTPGCHFGRHTPTLTILIFTPFHSFSQTLNSKPHPTFIPFFASIISPIIIIPFYYASKAGSIYSCITFAFISQPSANGNWTGGSCWLAHSVVWPGSLLFVFKGILFKGVFFSYHLHVQHG